MPHYSTIYCPCPSIIGTKLFKKFSEIVTYTGRTAENGLASGFDLELRHGKLAFNFCAAFELAKSLYEFQCYVDQVVEEEKMLYLKARISETRDYT